MYEITSDEQLKKDLKNSYGTQFQEIISSLMIKIHHTSYQPTSTSGPRGDLGVDGVLNKKIAFAIHAPEKYHEKNILNKIDHDFNRFMENKSHWKNIEEYVFIIKQDRTGTSPFILEKIYDLEKIIPTKLLTLQHIYNLIDSNINFFNTDNTLLINFKKDITPIAEYIISHDFASEAFDIEILDDMDSIIDTWKSKKYIFSNKKLENIKNNMLTLIEELSTQYLTPEYIRSIPDGRLLFDNSYLEAHTVYNEIFSPNIQRIRYNLKKELDALYQ
ncbi:hypothetical protein [Megamonas hypermegale]|uniref:hypothetical protein n=1 Tax=Megamonas hypermegale TaxID=158847 RepID=UPI001957745C|nr:hypothetical protein [Megamonas hypermegale]MBM6760918.1 hypothetical protein [Megamonas hypermegale]